GVLDTLRGLRSIDVGTGGESTAMPVAIHPYSEVISDAFGGLKLTLYADHYTWEFVPMPGETFTDRGSGTCHGGVDEGCRRPPAGPASSRTGGLRCPGRPGTAAPGSPPPARPWTGEPGRPA